MSATTPAVPLKDHCSVIHDNVLYVYSPEAFQTLPLKEGGKWDQQENGVSVTGAACVKGGIDGDSSRSALYVVGGIANATTSDYSGLQRYSFQDRSWEIIEPVVAVTKHRQNHGVAFINASSALVVYGGSQDGYAGATSQTFVMDTFPPYAVQAYSSSAPPTIRPYMLPWSEDRAFMVGGSDTNQNIFTFGPNDGWQDLGLALPYPLPEQPAAQAAVLTLDDGSRILQTFKLDEVPISVTTNVLLNPGGTPAFFNETVGQPSTPPSLLKRQTSFSNFPSYDPSTGPETTRTGFSLAQGDDGLVAFVGGDADNPVAFFNQTGNGWVQANALLGDQPRSTTSSRPSPPSSIPTSSPTTEAASGGNGTRRSLRILGGVLGGVCGVAAILIVLLLVLRNVRRKKRKEREKARDSTTPEAKGWTEINIEDGSMKPLARQGQAMGRSPVVSTVGPPVEIGKSTMLAPGPSEKHLIRRVSADAMPKSEPAFDNRPGFTQNRMRREKSPLTISRPMNPDLGHYNVRPSIDLGRATPASPINATALAAAVPGPQRNRSQRKTDEAWGKYFAREGMNPSVNNAGHSRNKSKDSQGGFWPGAGVTERSTRPPKLAFRNTEGQPLEQRTVAAASPSLERGPSGQQSRNLQGVAGRISSGESMSGDSDYEDHVLEGAFSSGIPDSVPDTWSPMESNSSGQRATRTSQSLALPTTSSMKTTSDTSGTNSSGIPNFPMPTPTNRSLRQSGGNSTLASVDNVQVPTHFQTTTRRPREPSDYFGRGPGQDGMPTNNDMSWLNLGTPGGQRENR